MLGRLVGMVVMIMVCVRLGCLPGVFNDESCVAIAMTKLESTRAQAIRHDAGGINCVRRNKTNECNKRCNALVRMATLNQGDASTAVVVFFSILLLDRRRVKPTLFDVYWPTCTCRRLFPHMPGMSSNTPGRGVWHFVHLPLLSAQLVTA